MKRSMQEVEDRRHQIVTLLDNALNKQLSVADLASALNVSVMTMRRDLTRLDRMGIIERLHGKARLISQPKNEGDTNNYHLEQIKYAIAKKAATFIKSDMTVFMNTGSTALNTVDFLKELPVTVITNNLNMSHKPMHPRSTIILLGGEILFPKAALVGELAAESLKHIQANICIMSCSGLSVHEGITTGDFRESKINRLMIERCGGLVIVVADYRKIGTNANFSIAALNAIDILITDVYADPQIIKQIEKQGIKVIQVDYQM